MFCGVTSWAGGWLLIARDDDGAEVEVDELGARYGTTSPVSCESHQLDRHEPDC